jgi:hypothetical protein
MFLKMSLHTTYWVLRQNYGSKTNQRQMKALIKQQKIVTCPWGGWSKSRQNVVDGIFNEDEDNITRPGGRSSKGQDRKFVEDMKIGDIVLIPFTHKQGCIVARIVSDVNYAINTGLYWRENNAQITISASGDLPFRPVGRQIEIITEDFTPDCSLGQWTLSKMNKAIVDKLNNL